MVNVYKIYNVSTHKIVYVGFTDRDLTTRFNEHKKDEKRIHKFLYLKQNKCAIALLCQVEETYARSEESFYINLYNPELNIQNVNPKFKVDNAIKKALKLIKNLNN